MWIRINLISCLIIMISWTLCSGQVFKVQLHPKIGPENGRTIIKGYPFKGLQEVGQLDTDRFDLWEIYSFAFNSDQSAVDKVGLEYLSEIGEKVDTRFIYKDGIPKNNILAFVGIGKDSMVYVAVDKNNDGDLMDEKWHTFRKNPDNEKFESDYIPITCEISYFDGKGLRDTVLPMELNVVRPPKGFKGIPGISDKDPVKNLCEVQLMKISYKEGELDYRGKTYRIRITDPTYNLYPFDQEYSLAVEEMPPKGKSSNYSYPSDTGDPVRIGTGLFKIPTRIKDLITFTYLRDAPQENGQIGKKLPSSSFTDLANGKKMTDIIADGNRYLILDLWASWCGPCIAALPELLSVSKRFPSEKVQIVSLAIDKPENIEKIKRIIKENGLTWPQYFLDSGSTGSIFLKEIEIQYFPATFLISPKGDVLYRGVSVTSLEEAVKELESVISEK
ncbi:TlpA family protein disulfide reductase [Sphingobacterium endophyticum]|uniref:TlpA family protein disulfide reductase n=1 Tax=Sphingobacterium endophyticum TaxID=2546448 RepID=UPI0012E20CBD|nr:TlpA disulfide reductase family protein [Sphingobacterium endophyticum]